MGNETELFIPVFLQMREDVEHLKGSARTRTKKDEEEEEERPKAKEPSGSEVIRETPSSAQAERFDILEVNSLFF